MKAIVAISDVLQVNFVAFLPVVLRKLVEKTSDGINSIYIQNIALESINTIASNVGCQSSAEVMSLHFLPLINSIIMDLRQPWSQELFFEQSISFHSLHKIIELLLESFLSKHTEHIRKDHPLCNDTHVITLSETLNETFCWFNKCLRQCSQARIHELRIQHTLIRLFTISAKYFLAQISIWKALKTNIEAPDIPEKEPWLNLLLLHEMPLSTQNALDVEEKCPEEADYVPDLEHEDPKEDDGKAELDKVKLVKASVIQMMSCSCYFLSSSDFKIQRQSCEMLRHGFKLLDCMTKRFFDTESPIHEAVSKYWPSIKSEFQKASQSIVDVDKDFEAIPLRFNGNLYLSLLHLIEILCSVTPGAIQFSVDVWPFMSNIVSYDYCIHEEAKVKSRNHQQDSTRILLDAIVTSILSCICVYFNSPTCCNEEQLVPVIGATLIPILSRECEVGDAATRALLALAKIDCDSLWRFLLLAGQENLPPRKIMPFPATKFPDEAKPSPIFIDRIRSLVSFINQLPEPILE